MGRAIGFYAAGVKVLEGTGSYAAHQYCRHGFTGYGAQRVALAVIMMLVTVLAVFGIAYYVAKRM